MPDESTACVVAPTGMEEVVAEKVEINPTSESLAWPSSLLTTKAITYANKVRSFRSKRGNTSVFSTVIRNGRKAKTGQVVPVLEDSPRTVPSVRMMLFLAVLTTPVSHQKSTKELLLHDEEIVVRPLTALGELSDDPAPQTEGAAHIQTWIEEQRSAFLAIEIKEMDEDNEVELTSLTPDARRAECLRGPRRGLRRGPRPPPVVVLPVPKPTTTKTKWVFAQFQAEADNQKEDKKPSGSTARRCAKSTVP